jgi:hypothetical protein
MNTSEQINEIAGALAKAQAEIKNPAKTHTNPHFKTKYADLTDGLEVIRPALSKHGICVIQATEIDGDNMVLRTRLAHASGQWIESVYPVCKIGAHQAMGAAMTYSRRYALFSLVGVAGEDDTDGEGAAEPVGGSRRQERPSRAPAPAPAREDAAAYVEQAEREMADIDSVDRLTVWWGHEAKNRALHFTDRNDPLLKRLKDAIAKRGADLAPPQQEAAE